MPGSENPETVVNVDVPVLTEPHGGSNTASIWQCVDLVPNTQLDPTDNKVMHLHLKVTTQFPVLVKPVPRSCGFQEDQDTQPDSTWPDGWVKCAAL